jgi:type IV secretion system protein VirB2
MAFLIDPSFLALSPSLALAAGTGGASLPWETPLQNVQQSLTGPVAKGIALVAIVGAWERCYSSTPK